jgi:O-antigen/teichoic acid export membrane protein
MVGLIVTMVAGVEIGVIGNLVGLEVTAAAWLAVIGAVVFFVLLFAWVALRIPRNQARLPARFPSGAPREDVQD